MNLYVKRWDNSVEGLTASGDELTLWGMRLGDVVGWAAAKAGVTVVDEILHGVETLILEGGVGVRPEALTLLLKAARKAGGDCRLTVGGAVGAFVDSAVFGLAPTHITYLTASGTEDFEARMEDTALITVEPEERTMEVANGIDWIVSDHILAPIRHWNTLLWVNLLGLGPRLWGECVQRPALWGAMRCAWAGLTKLNWSAESLAAALTSKGSGVRIHKSAVVEGCILGVGVVVGPNAVVRGSIVGRGSVIEAQALVEGSILAPKVLVQRQAMLKYCVVEGGASVAGTAQLSVFGSKASLKAGSFTMDQALKGDVCVLVGNCKTPAPKNMSGACIGEGTTVGSGVWVAPGRAVGAGITIVRGEVLTDPRHDGEAGEAMVVVDGRLESR